METTCLELPFLKVAEELKGLQEQSTPFSDELALQILAEDADQAGAHVYVYV